MAYLQKKWTFRKSGLRTFTKNRHYVKIHCGGQKHLYDKLEVAGFKYDSLETPKSDIFGPKVTDF